MNKSLSQKVNTFIRIVVIYFLRHNKLKLFFINVR